MTRMQILRGVYPERSERAHRTRCTQNDTQGTLRMTPPRRCHPEQSERVQKAHSAQDDNFPTLSP